MRLSKKKLEVAFKTPTKGSATSSSRLIIAQLLDNLPNNVSKVVDENGEPLVVYRGAPYDPLAQEAGKGIIAPERYFTPDEQYAKRYEKGDGVTRAYFLNIRNPFDVRNERDAQRNLAQLIRDAKVAVDEVKSPASITSRSRRLLRKW